MDAEVDHYAVLGLPSGEEGAKLTEKEISKGYKFKALELHPDKRPDDPNAHANFQKLKSSYEILRDEKARKLFDDLLRVKRERASRHSSKDAKRRKMVSDLEEREKSLFAPDTEAVQRQEEERISRKLKGEIDRIRAMMRTGRDGANKHGEGLAETERKRDSGGTTRGSSNEERILKVSWDKGGGEDYNSDKLRDTFSEFGDVEDVVIKSSKKRGSALVVMGTKDAVIAATKKMCGSLSNPLLVVPLQPAHGSVDDPLSAKFVERDPLINLVGAGYKAYEDSVLEKLQRAAAAKRN